MNYKIIATGSKGNAAVIDNQILIDCGVSFKKLSDVYADLQIVLLTHIHSDHFRHTTIKVLKDMRPMLRYGCCEWLVDDLMRCGVNPNKIDVYEIGKKYDYGSFAVSPVNLYHNVQNCGYRIYLNDKRCFYATDTATLGGISAENYDLYLVEANYNKEKHMKIINKKLSKEQYCYELNAMGNHMDEADTKSWINKNSGENSKVVYLHGHRYEH